MLEAGGELGDLDPRRPGLVTVDVAVGGGHHEHDVRFDLTEGVFEDLLGAYRFGPGGLEPTSDQVAGDAAAVHRRGDHQQEPEHQRAAVATDHQRTKTSEHGRLPF